MPDFLLTTVQTVTLPLAGKSEIAVQVVRSGGFDGEIALSVEDLPDGVTAIGDWKIPAGQSEAKVTLESAADAAVVAKLIRIAGSSVVGTTGDFVGSPRPMVQEICAHGNSLIARFLKHCWP